MPGQRTDIENLENSPDTQKLDTKAILITILGLTVVGLLIFGTKRSVDYIHMVSCPEVPRQPTGYCDFESPDFLVLKREGNDSVLLVSESGIETEIYRDTGIIVNPTVSPDGKRFAFCKFVEDANGIVTGSELYIKPFDSMEFPEEAFGISPHLCNYSFSQDSKYIIHVTNSPQRDCLIICSYNIERKFNTLITRRAAIIVTPVIAINESENEYSVLYYAVHDDREGKYTLQKYNIRPNENTNDTVCDSASILDFSISKDESKVLILEKGSDTLKIFVNGDFTTHLEFTKKNFSMKKAMVSTDGESIYCLVCSKKDADSCKIIEASFKRDRLSTKTKYLIQSNGIVDFALKPRV